MAIEDTIASYKVEITKTGTGAAQAIAEFQALRTEAQATSTAMSGVFATGTAASNTALTSLSNTSKSATATLKAMQGTLTLVGMQTFPQLTLAAATASQAIAGMRAASAATSIGLGPLAASLAVIGASLYSILKAWNELKGFWQAKEVLGESEQALAEKVEANNNRLKVITQQLLDAGRIQQEAADKLFTLLETPSYEANRQAQGQLAPIMQQLGALEQLIKLQREAFKESLGPKGIESMRLSEEYAARVKKIKELRDAMGDLEGAQEGFDLAMQAANDAYVAGQQRLIDKTNEATVNVMSQRDMVVSGIGQFSAGFSHTLVDSIKGAKDAWRDFAADFLSSIGEMIAQQAVLKLIKSTSWGSSFFAAEGGMFPSKAADGGMFPRMMAGGGMQELSRPTYFPRFNVMAGEAGREIMAVLARPKMMQVGGVQAMVGDAGGAKLALSNVGDLANRNGGEIYIRVMMGEGLKAEIVSSSIQGAKLEIVNDMKNDTPISRGVKGLSS